MSDKKITVENEVVSLEETEQKIELRLNDIADITDPGEKLLAYRQLQEGYKGSFNPDEGKKRSEGSSLAGFETSKTTSIEEEINREFRARGANAGFVAGAAAVFAAFTIPLIAVGLPVAVVAFVGLWVAGYNLGKKKGPKEFKKLPAKQQLASKLYELDRFVNNAIARLSATDDKNIDVLSKSSAFEDVKKSFPDVAAAFNARASAEKKRQAFVVEPQTTRPASAAGQPSAQ